MRTLPAAVRVETLLRRRRHEHHRAIRSSALARRPQIRPPPPLLRPLTGVFHAPVAALNPVDPPAGAAIGAELQETPAIAAIDPDSRHVAWTDDTGRESDGSEALSGQGRESKKAALPDV